MLDDKVGYSVVDAIKLFKDRGVEDSKMHEPITLRLDRHYVPLYGTGF